jgi:hypothetical protein
VLEPTSEEMLKLVAFRDLMGWRTRAEVVAGVTEHMKVWDAAQAAMLSPYCYDRQGQKLSKPYRWLRGLTIQQLATPAYGRIFDMFVKIHRDHRDRCVHCGAT